MKKTSLGIIISMIAMIGGAFADDTLNDCNIVTEKEAIGSMRLYSIMNYSGVLPQEAFAKAILHLQAYCCNQKKIQCSATLVKKLPPEKTYPQSPYLFDHLIDVTMRRLDGVPGKLVYDLPVDKAGKTRRDAITKLANNTNGEQASTVKEEFIKYRTLHKKATKDMDTVKKLFGGENTSGFSLADRYNTVCRLMKDIYEEIQDKKTDI